jgi:hypothetical protein
MSIVVTGAIESYLRPGLNKVMFEFDTNPKLYKEMFGIRKSNMAVERLVDAKTTSFAAEKAEGAAIAMDDMAEKYTYEFTHRTFALGMTISKEAQEDNLYEQQMMSYSKQIATSYEATREVMGASVLNQAFSANVLLPDGQPLCSIAHPVDGTTFSNRVAQNASADVSEAALEQAIILARKFKKLNGMPVVMEASKMVIPVDQIMNAQRVTQSEFRSGTANNDLNAIKSLRVLPNGFVDNVYLTTPNWFVLTRSYESSLIHFERSPLTINVVKKDDIGATQILGSGRYSFGTYTPYGIVGCAGQ